jgi:hypothetical protein
MNFTTDGYTEPLAPRPAGLAIGALILAGGVAAVFAGWMCSGVALVVLGGLTALNETGTRRVRVTRSKLLMESESRVRGLLIGPRRERMTWDEVADVSLADDHIRMTGKDGTVLVLGQGGPASDLERLKSRIDSSREGL